MAGHLRLPREPYPGLRPFMDFEAPLLFGRDRQVAEVVSRLAATQFVAVLGGSGSGKSSLVIAGVTPYLRSHGIPGAGDLWVPMVCTPGTNAGAAADASPVARLARRFSTLLGSRGSAEADARRQAEIADVFRQEAGFARLLDAYGSELALPPGPDAADARLLVVLDQFEEVFHPSNRGNDDVRLLVERVLDHFYAPHPRCHLILTMRSEFLNDCAAFLELPDAINRSSYLVRRLDGDELRQVVVGPAQRFLRLMARRERGRQFPAAVDFEPAVLERVMRDTLAMAGDPDHLPLLQHLLARLWQVALQRDVDGSPVPAAILMADLVQAADPGATALAPDTNTLRASVERWPERAYQALAPQAQQQLEALLSRLALRDPGTGQYTQQRLAVDDAALLFGPGHTAADVRVLLGDDFLGGVDYLFWDDANPARVTIKPSHESFIRGWPRFRALVDAQARRVGELQRLLQRCADWQASGQQVDLLLEANETRRLLGDGLLQRLADPMQRSGWEQLLALDPGAARWRHALPNVQQFVELSQRRNAHRRVARLGPAAAFALLAVTVSVYAVMVQTPTLARLGLLVEASNAVAAEPLPDGDDDSGVSPAALGRLLAAAVQVDGAVTGRGVRLGWVADRLRFPPFTWIGSPRNVLASVGAQTESVVNRRLRSALTYAVWAQPASAAVPADAVPALQVQAATCTAHDGTAVRGRRFSPAAAPRQLFLPDAPAAPLRRPLLAATRDDATGRCTLDSEPVVKALPRDAALVVDPELRHLLVAGTEDGKVGTQVYELLWEGGDTPPRGSVGVLLLVASDPALAAWVKAAAGDAPLAAVAARRVAAGLALAAAGSSWRLVLPTAQPVPGGTMDGSVIAAQPAPAGSACVTAAQTMGLLSETRLFDLPGHCLAIGRSANDAVVRYSAALFRRPNGDRMAAAVGPPLASVYSILRLPAGAGEPLSWDWVESGPQRGWLLARLPLAASGAQLLGVPMSTCALWRLGREMGAAADAPDSTCASP